jgi:hypothetical protein
MARGRRLIAALAAMRMIYGARSICHQRLTTGLVEGEALLPRSSADDRWFIRFGTTIFGDTSGRRFAGILAMLVTQLCSPISVRRVHDVRAVAIAVLMRARTGC